MPYSFTQIEKDKSNSIGLVFIFLIFFYFIVSLLLYSAGKFYLIYEKHRYYHSYDTYTPPETAAEEPSLILNLSPNEIILILMLSFVVAIVHFLISTNNIIFKITTTLQATPINPQDTYHSRFKNVLDEMKVAVGGLDVEGVVIPSSAMNAFALADLEGRCVIGVTEGLLSRLNRAQLETVVAHEAAHIITGDCVQTTVTSSLFEMYGDILSTMQDSIRVTARLGEAAVFIIFGYMLLQATVVVSNLFKMFISREREFRADAIAVRLTRDPLSLAEALYLIGRRWRGSGLPGDGMESIFIVNPRFDQMDENTGTFSDLFSTHPPLQKRLEILLNMAHSTMESLKAGSEGPSPKEAAPEMPAAVVAALNIPVVELPESPDQQWEIYNNGQWRGPFTVAQMMSQGWVEYDAFVRKVGDNRIERLFEAASIKKFNSQGVNSTGKSIMCSICQVNLNEDLYKGAPILRCLHCGGVLLYENDVQKILIRDDYFFSDQIRSMGDALMQQQEHLPPNVIDLKSANLLLCPRCEDPKPRMLRYFYNMAYPIEVDRCRTCASIWFDRNELEILQYLIGKSKQKNDEITQ